MKNQNDMIWSIVSIVLALIIAGVCFGTMRQPIPPAAPTAVNIAPPQYPATTVVMDNALPNGGNGQGGGGQMGGARGPAAVGAAGAPGGPAIAGVTAAGGGGGGAAVGSQN